MRCAPDDLDVKMFPTKKYFEPGSKRMDIGLDEHVQCTVCICVRISIRKWLITSMRLSFSMHFYRFCKDPPLHCRFYFQKLGKGHNSQKWRSHAISFYRITLPDNAQMGDKTNIFLAFHLLSWDFLSPYPAVHPGYNLHVQYPEYTISPSLNVHSRP